MTLFKDRERKGEIESFPIELRMMEVWQFWHCYGIIVRNSMLRLQSKDSYVENVKEIRSET